MVSKSDDMLLSVEGLMTGEKLRGAVASVISGSTAAGLNLLGVSSMGLSATTSALFFTFMTGSFFSYVLDVMIAKRAFVVRGGSGMPEDLPYSALWARLAWLLRSFRRRFFFRFLITIIIETLTGLAMLRAAIRLLNKHEVLMDWPLRDVFAAIVVSCINFVLYGNILRFDWAYREVEHPLLNMVVLMWMALVMIVFSTAVTPK